MDEKSLSQLYGHCNVSIACLIHSGGLKNIFRTEKLDKPMKNH